MTPRQLQVLRLAADGLTMDEIAARIYLSAWSVKNELVRARRRLHAHNTAHAVAIAMSRNLIPGAGRPRPRHRPAKGTRSTGTGWPA